MWRKKLLFVCQGRQNKPKNRLFWTCQIHQYYMDRVKDPIRILRREGRVDCHYCYYYYSPFSLFLISAVENATLLCQDQVLPIGYCY